MNTKHKLIQVQMMRYSPVPLYVLAGHRHLEKSQQVGTDENTVSTFIVPVDMASLGAIPPQLVEGITGITLHYKKQP